MNKTQKTVFLILIITLSTTLILSSLDFAPFYRWSIVDYLESDDVLFRVIAAELVLFGGLIFLTKSNKKIEE